MFYELRNKGRTFVLSLLPQGRRQLNQVRQFAQTMNQAAAPENYNHIGIYSNGGL